MKRIVFIVLIITLLDLGNLCAMESALQVGHKIPQPLFLLILAAQLEENQLPKRAKGEYPCPWPGCTKILTTNEFQKIHIRVHTNERPYACTAAGCEDRFKQLAHLNDHVRIHTNSKPYICRQAHCGKSFRTSTARKKHEQACNMQEQQKSKNPS